MSFVTAAEEYPILTRVFYDDETAITVADAHQAYLAHQASESGIKGWPIDSRTEGFFINAERVGYRAKTSDGKDEYVRCHWRHSDGTGEPYGVTFRAGRENDPYVGGSINVSQFSADHPGRYKVEPIEYSAMKESGIETIGDKFRVLRLVNPVYARDAPKSPEMNKPPAYSIIPVKIPTEHDFYSYVPGQGGRHWKDKDTSGRDVTFFEDGERSGTLLGDKFGAGSYQKRSEVGVTYKWNHFTRNVKEELTEHSVFKPGFESVVEVPRGYPGQVNSNTSTSCTGFLPIPRD